MGWRRIFLEISVWTDARDISKVLRYALEIVCIVLWVISDALLGFAHILVAQIETSPK